MGVSLKFWSVTMAHHFSLKNLNPSVFNLDLLMLRRVHITHRRNREAESGIKMAKRILKQEDPFIALMAYRATQISATGASPIDNGQAESDNGSDIEP